MKEIAVYVGRLNPIHLWHEAVINAMLQKYGTDCLLVLWSANHEQSLRHFFSYEERKILVRKLYPDIKIAPLPDFGNDTEWLSALDDLIDNTFHTYTERRVLFFWGCREDVSFFENDGRNIEVMNRFDGTTPLVSATEVRDALITWRSLDGLVNPTIKWDILDLFWHKWEIFKKK